MTEEQELEEIDAPLDNSPLTTEEIRDFITHAGEERALELILEVFNDLLDTVKELTERVKELEKPDPFGFKDNFPWKQPQPYQPNPYQYPQTPIIWNMCSTVRAETNNAKNQHVYYSNGTDTGNISLILHKQVADDTTDKA